MKKNKIKNTKAFTVVELLIVIVIIGILAAITIVSYVNITGRAGDASVSSSARQIDAAQKIYLTNSGTVAKSWYSGTTAVDTDLKVNLAPGTVTDVAVNGTDYCIRTYNSSSSLYKVLGTALSKGSSATSCATIPASLAAINAAFAGDVTTLAGSGTAAAVDGTGTGASFWSPQDMAIDPTKSYLYVADAGGNKIRKVEIATGIVTTLAGSGTAGFVDGTGTGASFNSPKSITIDSTGTNLYVSDGYYTSGRVRKIVVATGVVTTIAGSTAGYLDATGTAAQFSAYTNGITIDPSGSNLYLADAANARIRKVNLSTNAVTTFAGSGNSASNLDGTGTGANIPWPSGITIDPSGTNIYFSQGEGTNNLNHIRKIVVATGAVTTIAGSGSNSYADGIGSAAAFYQPVGLDLDPTGSYLYVADKSNSIIRKIDLSNMAVTKISGIRNAGIAPSVDGNSSTAQYTYPRAVMVDGSGANIYVLESGNSAGKIRILR